MNMKKNKVTFKVDLQCGSCGAVVHVEDEPPRFCLCCGAAYERYCIRCQKKVKMYFEEWWPEDDECVRTYTPAKRCPSCSAGLEVQLRDGAGENSTYEH